MNQFNKRTRLPVGNIFNKNYYESDIDNPPTPSDIKVIDNLYTNDPFNALSAAQGVVLKQANDMNTTLIEEQETTVNNLSSTVGTLNTTVGTLSDSVNTLSGRVNIIDGVVSSNTQRISSLETTTQTLMTGVNTLDGHVSDLLAQVNQDVRTTATPTFANITCGTTNVNTALSTINSINSMLDQPVKTTSKVKFAGIQLGTSTDTNTTRMITALDSSMTVPSSRFFTLGRAASNGDQAEIAFTYNGANASTNELSLGFFNNKLVSFYNDNRAYLNCGLILNAISAPALSTEGGVTWNNTTHTMKVYGGGTWSDVMTRAQPGAIVGGLSFVVAKSDQGSLGWNYVYDAFGCCSSPGGLNSGDQSYIAINLSYDPGSVTGIVTVLGQTTNFPAGYTWNCFRDSTFVFRVQPVQGSPAWNALGNITGFGANLMSIMPNNSSIHMRLIVIKT